MSVFEFCEPGTHLRVYGTYQTSHGEPHCPILMSLLLSQILGLTLNLPGPNNSSVTANNPGGWMSSLTVLDDHKTNTPPSKPTFFSQTIFHFHIISAHCRGGEELMPTIVRQFRK